MGGIELMVIILDLILNHIIIIVSFWSGVFLLNLIFIFISSSPIYVDLDQHIPCHDHHQHVDHDDHDKVRILADSNKHLKLHAAESLSKLAKYKKVFAADNYQLWRSYDHWSMIIIMLLQFLLSNITGSWQSKRIWLTTEYSLKAQPTHTGEKDCEKEQWDPKGSWPSGRRHEQGDGDGVGRHF